MFKEGRKETRECCVKMLDRKLSWLLKSRASYGNNCNTLVRNQNKPVFSFADVEFRVLQNNTKIISFK